MQSDRLFEVPEVQVTVAPTADRRRTARQRAMLARGLHPVTGGPVREGTTCGACIHLFRREWTRKTYFKCDLTRMTHGAGSDIRLSWPGCSRFDNGWADVPPAKGEEPT